MGSAPTVRPGLYTTVKGSPHAQRMTNSKNNEMNNNFVFNGDANLQHKPQFWVGIFNVSDLEQRIERPWVHTRRFGAPSAERRPTAKLIVVPACKPGDIYGTPFVIPDIIQMPEERSGSWNFRTFGQDGRFLAQDAINPEDPRGNWKTARRLDAGSSVNEGTNLYNFGCFWMAAPTIEQLIPEEDMIDSAHKRLEETYNYLIEEGNNFAMQGPEGIKLIGNLHRRAANYFGLDLEWNKRYTRRIACPNCSEPVAATAAVCPKCPAVLNWEKALALGLRSRQQAIDAGVIAEQADHFAAEAPAEQKPAKKTKKKTEV